MSYLLIFGAKTLENILTTIRIILISNHRKILGSILSIFITLIWIFTTVSILRNIWGDPLNLVAYTGGCCLGSYLGCLIEEKIALGDNMITCITEDDNNIVDKLRQLNYQVTTIDGYGINDKKKVLLIMTKRKKKYRLARLIKFIDRSATVITENATYYDSK